MVFAPTFRPFAESLRCAGDFAQRRVRASQLSVAIAGVIFGSGLLFGWFSGNQSALFFFFLFALVLGLSTYAVLLWRAKRLACKTLRNNYESLFAALERADRKSARQLFANILVLAPSLLPAHQGLVDHVGDSFDFVSHTFMHLLGIAPPMESLEQLESKAIQIESLMIHLNEGLVNDPELRRSLRVEIEKMVTEAESRAKILQVTIDAETILMEELKETEKLLRQSIGFPEAIVTKNLNLFLTAKQTRRLKITFHFSDLLECLQRPS